MCLLIFIRISAATLRGQQRKSCNFTEILKAQKFLVVRLVINFFIFYFASLGFGRAEYNDRPINEQKKIGGGGVCFCPRKWMQIPENEVHCPGFV